MIAMTTRIAGYISAEESVLRIAFALSMWSASRSRTTSSAPPDSPARSRLM